MSLQHNGGCEPSKFDSELERQLPHLLLSWETLSGDCKKVMSRTTRVDIKIHFRAFSAFSASVKFLPFVWLELEIHPRAIKIEFPLKICRQIWVYVLWVLALWSVVLWPTCGSYTTWALSRDQLDFLWTHTVSSMSQLLSHWPKRFVGTIAKTIF